MNAIFHIVYSALMLLSDLTGLTYNEVNIVVYYIILPFGYVVLADKIWKKHYLKVGYIFSVLVILFLIHDFKVFSDWLFQKSVDFLLSFQIFGWNYTVSSVLICVIFPGIVFVLMFFLAYPKIGRQVIPLIRFAFSDRTEFDSKEGS